MLLRRGILGKSAATTDLVLWRSVAIESFIGKIHRTVISMDVLAERLDQRLREWSPETAEQVRDRVSEIMELADEGLLDLVRSRKVEQEVLDLLDEPTSR